MTKKRNLETFDLDSPAKAALKRLKKKTGWTKKAVIQRLLFTAEAHPELFKI